MSCELEVRKRSLCLFSNCNSHSIITSIVWTYDHRLLQESKWYCDCISLINKKNIIIIGFWLLLYLSIYIKCLLVWIGAAGSCLSGAERHPSDEQCACPVLSWPLSVFWVGWGLGVPSNHSHGMSVCLLSSYLLVSVKRWMCAMV